MAEHPGGRLDRGVDRDRLVERPVVDHRGVEGRLLEVPIILEVREGVGLAADGDPRGIRTALGRRDSGPLGRTDGRRGRKADARCGHHDHRNGDRQGAVGGEAQEHVAPVQAAADRASRRRAGDALTDALGRVAGGDGGPLPGLGGRGQEIGADAGNTNRSAMGPSRGLRFRRLVRGAFESLGAVLRKATHDAAHGVQQYGLLAGRSVRGGARGVLGSGPSRVAILSWGSLFAAEAHSSAGVDVAPTLPRPPSARQTR